MPPKLDVILTTNRQSPFLEETLGSVEAQNGVECNIILVDDGSPNPAHLRSLTARIANAVVIRQANAGISAARNRGLRESCAPLVAFLDDDDWWHPLKARQQVEELERHRHAVACSCWGSYIDATGAVLGSWAPAETAASSDVIRGAAHLPRIVTLVARREACEAVGGFNVTYRYCEDIEFMFRLLLYGDFVSVPEKLVHYRMHSSNASAGVRHQAVAEADRMLSELIKLCHGEGDTNTAALFEENRTAHHRDACLASLRVLKRALYSRSRSDAAEEAGWLLRHPGWLAEGARGTYSLWRDPSLGSRGRSASGTSVL